MRHALLIYGAGGPSAEVQREIEAVLTRPNVTGWFRLDAAESATTVNRRDGATLLTDGPFIDSKEFLAGVILLEADNLDGALASAAELQDLRPAGAIEVRPMRDAEFRGA